MLDAVFDIGSISQIFQGLDLLPQFELVPGENRRGNHVKPVLLQRLPGRVAQNLQRSPVDADDMAPVQGMTHNPAVHGGKDRLKRLIFADQFLGIDVLLRHVERDAHRPHHAAVQIVQRRLIGGKDPLFPSRLDDLLRDMGLPVLHHEALRLDAGRVVLLHVPDIGVAPPLHLFFGLVDCVAEAVVHLFVDAVFGLIPDQIGGTVDRRLQELICLPMVLPLLIALLPAQKVEPQLRLRHRQRPNICNPGQKRGGAR